MMLIYTAQIKLHSQSTEKRNKLPLESTLHLSMLVEVLVGAGGHGNETSDVR